MSDSDDTLTGEGLNPDVSWLSNPAHCLSLGFGSGLASKAPGTFGSIAALPLIGVLWWVEASLFAQVAWAMTITALGAASAGYTARALKTHDHGAIVIDEIAGIAITFIAIPPSWLAVLLGFGLFRLLDIAKPWPIGWLDKSVGGGIGIMADDVLAGLIACAVLHGLIAYGVI